MYLSGAPLRLGDPATISPLSVTAGVQGRSGRSGAMSIDDVAQPARSNGNHARIGLGARIFRLPVLKISIGDVDRPLDQVHRVSNQIALVDRLWRRWPRARC